MGCEASRRCIRLLRHASAGIPGDRIRVSRTDEARARAARWRSDESCARHTGDDDGAEEPASEHSEDTLPPLNGFSAPCSLPLPIMRKMSSWTHGEAEDNKRGHGGPGTRVQQVTT